MFKFTQGDIVKRVTKSRNLNSWSCIVEWWIYKVSTVHNDYVTLEWIVWNISSDSLILYQMQVWDYVRRIKEDYEDVIVWCIYKVSSILRQSRDIKIEWSWWAYGKDYFEPVLTTDHTTIGICPSSILVDETVNDSYPSMTSDNTLCHVVVTEKNGVRTPHVSHYSNPNPISLMSEKSFNDYAIEAFMSDAHNREEATDTAKVLETLDTNLELVLNEIQKIRKVISRDRINLSDAMKYCNIELITRIISENPAVEEFVNRFMENKLIDLVPPKEKVSVSIADKFK